VGSRANEKNVEGDRLVMSKYFAFIKKFRWASVALVIAVACLLLLLLRMGELATLDEDLARNTDQLDRMKRNLVNTRSLEQQVDQIEALTDDLDQRIIQPGDAAINISYFYSFENDEVRITSVTQGSKANVGPWKMEQFIPVLFTLEASGDFHGILDLCYRLRKGSKLVRLLSISISPEESALSSSRRATITLEALGAPPR